MRYLMAEQLRANLSLGRYVEQWLPPKHYDHYTIIRYISIEKNDELTYDVNYWEQYDDGNENFIDVYSFSDVDPDEPGILNTFNSIDEALNFVMANYNTLPDKFVNRGMIQEEYRDYVKAGRKS